MSPKASLRPSGITGRREGKPVLQLLSTNYARRQQRPPRPRVPAMPELSASSASDDSLEKSDASFLESEVSSDASELSTDGWEDTVAKRRAKRRTKARRSALGELSSELGALVDNPEYSDVIFNCKDGVQVRASRMLLIARSPVFKGMLGGGMVESKSEEIALPNISSSALLPALEFLYAGDFHRYEPTGVAILEVLQTANYLLLPKLERRAFNLAVLLVDSLCKNFQGEERELEALKLFCVAAANADLSNATTQNILYRIVIAMKHCRISLSILAQLSKDQVEMYVDIAQRWWRRGKGLASQVRFYHRVRLILLWCATRVSKEAAASLAPYLPHSEQTLIWLSETENADRSDPPERYYPEECGPLRQKKRVRTWVTKCRDMLRLSKVPIQLLCRVIEPLEVVSPVILSEAYRRRAMRPEVSILKWDSGMHGSQYRVRGRGSVIEFKEGAEDKYMARGFARIGMIFITDKRVGEWEFIVEEWCVGLQLGFYEPDPFDDADSYHESDLSECGWALTEEGLIDHKDHQYRDYAGKAQLQAHSRVRVHIEKQKCSFIINGVDYGMAWEDVPSEVFPACTLMHPGRVRIQNVVG